jgi:hypothetical protein
MTNKMNTFKLTAFFRFYAFLKIPLLWWVQPTILEAAPHRTELKIPLSRKTKNHLGTMYFGALAMGAEAAVAIKAIQAIRESQKPVDFIFKDFQAQFLKRAEGDVHFVCEQGDSVIALVDKCLLSEERETQSFQSYAIVPSVDPNAKIAEFTITLSVKKRRKKS